MNSTALTNRNFRAKAMFAFTAIVVIFAFVIRFTVYPPGLSDDSLQPNLLDRDSLFGSISVAIQASPNPWEEAGDDEILLIPFTTPTILSPCFFLPTFFSPNALFWRPRIDDTQSDTTRTFSP